MPFDSEGRFTRLHNWEEDRENGISIMSDRADEEDNNFADGLSETLVKDGRAPMTGNLKMSGFQIKNMANGTSENDATNLSQLNTARSEIMSELENQSTKTNDEFVKLKNAETFTETGKINIISFGMPNYKALVSKSPNTEYTADTNGYIYVRGFERGTIVIDGQSFGVGGRGYNYESDDTSVWPIQKGKKYKTPNLSSQTVYFIPCIGG